MSDLGFMRDGKLVTASALRKAFEKIVRMPESGLQVLRLPPHGKNAWR